jgi:hypothetical protein
MRMRTVIGALCALGAALVLSLGENALNAQQPPCDFVTGGGFIYPSGTPAGGKATFAIGGGCKNGALWGHLQYHDHAAGLTVQGTSITGYAVDDPHGRLICGTAKAKQASTTTDVNFVVRVRDLGEPGSQDEFDIAVEGLSPPYSTVVMPGFPHKLGGGTKGGGNIQLHKPNSNTVMLGTCPALGSSSTFTLTLVLTAPSPDASLVFPGGTVVSAPGGINCTLDSTVGVPSTPQTCSATFTPGTPATVVTLTATPDPNNADASFDLGCDPGTTTTPDPTAPPPRTFSCQVTMNGDRTVEVRFSFLE